MVPDDYDVIMQLFRKNVEEHPHAYPMGMNYHCMMLDNVMKNGRLLGVIGFEGQKAKAYFVGEVDEEMDLLVLSMFVDPSVQGRGVFRRMGEQMYKLCWKSGIRRAFSTVSSEKVKNLWEHFFGKHIVTEKGGVMIEVR